MAGKLSREEFRRQKDLEEARKAGTAAPEVDSETGKAINPHIPEFMSQAPWYLATGKPSLKHQKKPEQPGEVGRVGLDEWYARGARAGPAATKYRKGACENCGAKTHKTRDCLERPRKKGAKWSGQDIVADEVITHIAGLDKDWDAKRDRWNGYDPAMHKKIIDDYDAIEEARRKMREEEIDRQGTEASGVVAGESTEGTLNAAKKLAKKGKEKGTKAKKQGDEDDFSSESSAEEDEDKYAEKASMVGQKVDTEKRISVRNLRIREDRAKYLYNLSGESAYYDPKTRSMREAPEANVNPEDAQYAGDNFARASGDTVAMQKLQLFAWQAESRGNDVHLQANPTVNELQYKQFQQAKEQLRDRNKESILERYGGAEHFDSVPRELREGQTENYVEYSRTGKVIKGQERAKQKSKYEEDVFDQNHTAVWGSWYDSQTGQWGYGCCRNTMKGSYCTGKAGLEAAKASDALMHANTTKKAEDDSAKQKEIDAGEKEKGKKRARSASFESSSSYSSDSSTSYSQSEEERFRKSRYGRRSGRSHSSSYSSENDSDSSSRGHDRHRSSKDKHDRKSRKTAEGYTSRKNLGEGDVATRLDKSKLKAALKAEDERQADLERSKSRGGAKDEKDKPEWLKAAEEINNRKGGKKGFNSLKADDANVTEEQLEAYRMKKKVFDDPMNNFSADQEDL